MPTIPPSTSASQQTVPQARQETLANDWEDGADEPEFKPLTPQEAARWRATQPRWSPWRLVLLQFGVGLVLASLVWAVSGRQALAWSVAYGAACVFVPTALMAWGLTSGALSKMLARWRQGAFAGFLLWEGVKVLLAVAMMWSAPYWVESLDWLAMVAGVVVVLKVYWLSFWLQPKR